MWNSGKSPRAQEQTTEIIQLLPLEAQRWARGKLPQALETRPRTTVDLSCLLQATAHSTGATGSGQRRSVCAGFLSPPSKWFKTPAQYPGLETTLATTDLQVGPRGAAEVRRHPQCLQSWKCRLPLTYPWTHMRGTANTPQNVLVSPWTEDKQTESSNTERSVHHDQVAVILRMQGWFSTLKTHQFMTSHHQNKEQGHPWWSSG